MIGDRPGVELRHPASRCRSQTASSGRMRAWVSSLAAATRASWMSLSHSPAASAIRSSSVAARPASPPPAPRSAAPGRPDSGARPCDRPPASAALAGSARASSCASAAAIIRPSPISRGCAAGPHRCPWRWRCDRPAVAPGWRRGSGPKVGSTSGRVRVRQAPVPGLGDPARRRRSAAPCHGAPSPPACSTRSCRRARRAGPGRSPARAASISAMGPCFSSPDA